MADTFETPPATGGLYTPLGEAKLADHDGRSVRLGAGRTTVEITALAPDLFRVGMFPNGGERRYDTAAIAKTEVRSSFGRRETGSDLRGGRSKESMDCAEFRIVGG